jgi:hypothetical protein
MAHEDIVIDLSKTRHYEAGAIFLAVLAYPESEDEARGGLIFSLCNLALRAQFPLASPEAGSEQSLKPIYVLRPEPLIRKDLRTFDRRLRDRLVAADMAIALLQRATGLLPSQLPKGLRTLSLNELSTWVARKLPESQIKGGVREQANTETRVWRASLPVIHLAAALAIFNQAYDRQGHGEVRPVDILNQPELVEWIIAEAERLAEIIEKTGALGTKAVPLIRIRLAAG